MADILVLGVGPLPVDQAKRLYAPGLRIWSFAHQLALSGNNILLATADFGGQDYESSTSEPLKTSGGTVEFTKLNFDLKSIIKTIQRLNNNNKFKCAVSSTDLMNRALAQAHLPIPIWLDFNGHPMVERQMQAHVYQSDGGVKDQWDFVLPSIMFGDRFSTCSEPQKFALIGELGSIGRLNRFNSGVDLVESVQAVRHERNLETDKIILRDKIVSQDDFVLLWTGGYNTWTDVDILFEALEILMQNHSNFHYVSTGGKIDGHDEKTFPRFKEKIDQSEFKDRFHFLGWVDHEELCALYKESDAAINIDSQTYEAVFGHRTRVQEWIEAEVPVISTVISENMQILDNANLITKIEVGNSDSIVHQIEWMMKHPNKIKEQATLAKTWHKDNCNPEILLKNLVNWANNPQPASDLPPAESRGKLRWHGPENELSRNHFKYMKRNKLL